MILQHLQKLMNLKINLKNINMIYNHGDIVEMTAKEFSQIKFKKIRLTTTKEIEISVSQKSGKIFQGYIIGALGGSTNSPKSTTDIRFIDKSITSLLDENIDVNLSTKICIFDIESIEILES